MKDKLQFFFRCCCSASLAFHCKTIASIRPVHGCIWRDLSEVCDQFLSREPCLYQYFSPERCKCAWPVYLQRFRRLCCMMPIFSQSMCLARMYSANLGCTTRVRRELIARVVPPKFTGVTS